MRRTMISRVRILVLTGLILWPLVRQSEARAADPGPSEGTNTFPAVSEVLGGQTFENRTDEDIFFLRAIHDRYAAHWPDLLRANVTLNDYVLSPDKLLRFVTELGDAMRDRNDRVTVTNLAMITGDASFYANTNASHPEIIEAAARALIKIGPDGRKALASTFTESHYRDDPAGLEALAGVIGGERPGDREFVEALTATAFRFSAANGGSYPTCTTTAVENLLRLKDGPGAVQAHLKFEEMLNAPGRFQAIVDGIAAAHASELCTNLATVEVQIRQRLTALAGVPGGYRDDLQELETRVGRAVASLGTR